MGSRGGKPVYRRDDERSSHPSQEAAPTNSSAGVNAATDQTTSPRSFEPGDCESLVAFSLCFCFLSARSEQLFFVPAPSLSSPELSSLDVRRNGGIGVGLFSQEGSLLFGTLPDATLSPVFSMKQEHRSGLL